MSIKQHEFDEKLVLAWLVSHGNLQSYSPVDLARWQFNQCLITLDAQEVYIDHIVRSKDAEISALKAEIEDVKLTAKSNGWAATNASDKLIRANERIVEFEDIKKAHLEVQKTLQDKLSITEAVISCLSRTLNRIAMLGSGAKAYTADFTNEVNGMVRRELDDLEKHYYKNKEIEKT